MVLLFIIFFIQSITIVVSLNMDIGIIRLADRVVISYSNCLKYYPKSTNIATASALAILSDSVAQSIERKTIRAKTGVSTKQSFHRSLVMGIYGACVYGYIMTIWYQFLNSIIPAEGMTTSLLLLKVFIHQLCTSPTLSSLFFGYIILTRDFTKPLHEKYIQFQNKLKHDLLPTVKKATVYWGLFQIINFKIIPAMYSVLCTNIAFMIWTAYLSLVGFRKIPKI